MRVANEMYLYIIVFFVGTKIDKIGILTYKHNPILWWVAN